MIWYNTALGNHRKGDKKFVDAISVVVNWSNSFSDSENVIETPFESGPRMMPAFAILNL